MNYLQLSEEQRCYQESFREFTHNEVVPLAARHDRQESVSKPVIKKLIKRGYTGALTPAKYGGMGMDWITFGLLSEELGKGCTAVRSLVTVQNMVTATIDRWGNDQQKEKWLPRMAGGEALAAFAMTEPLAGSDAGSIQTSITQKKGIFVVHGHKKWISFGAGADIYLVLGNMEGKHCALLIEKNTPGITTAPIKDILGIRGSGVSEVIFNNCEVAAENLLGQAGFGLNPVCFTSLDVGRYSIAWGCVGLAQACLEASLHYVETRKQFNRYLKEFQLIRELITNMIVQTDASRLMCFQAGSLKMENHPGSFRQILSAKYFASRAAARVAGDAVQIHGAGGFGKEYPVERLYRDAKVMEMIEGSNQMLQIMIAKYGMHNYT